MHGHSAHCDIRSVATAANCTESESSCHHVNPSRPPAIAVISASLPLHPTSVTHGSGLVARNHVQLTHVFTRHVVAEGDMAHETILLTSGANVAELVHIARLAWMRGLSIVKGPSTWSAGWPSAWVRRRFVLAQAKAEWRHGSICWLASDFLGGVGDPIGGCHAIPIVFHGR